MSKRAAGNRPQVHICHLKGPTELQIGCFADAIRLHASNVQSHRISFGVSTANMLTVRDRQAAKTCLYMMLHGGLGKPAMLAKIQISASLGAATELQPDPCISYKQLASTIRLCTQYLLGPRCQGSPKGFGVMLLCLTSQHSPSLL